MSLDELEEILKERDAEFDVSGFRLFEMAYSLTLIDLLFEIRNFDVYSGEVHDPAFERVTNLFKRDWPKTKKYLKYSTISDIVKNEIKDGRPKEMYVKLTPDQKIKFWNLVDYFDKLLDDSRSPMLEVILNPLF